MRFLPFRVPVEYPADILDFKYCRGLGWLSRWKKKSFHLTFLDKGLYLSYAVCFMHAAVGGSSSPWALLAAAVALPTLAAAAHASHVSRPAAPVCCAARVAVSLSPRPNSCASAHAEATARTRDPEGEERDFDVWVCAGRFSRRTVLPRPGAFPDLGPADGSHRQSADEHPPRCLLQIDRNPDGFTETLGTLGTSMFLRVVATDATLAS